MKINLDFDEILNNAVNSAIDVTVNLSDKNPDAAGHAEQIERIAKFPQELRLKFSVSTTSCLRIPLISC